MFSLRRESDDDSEDDEWQQIKKVRARKYFDVPSSQRPDIANVMYSHVASSQSNFCSWTPYIGYALQRGRLDLAELIFRVEREQDLCDPPKDKTDLQDPNKRTAERVWYERVVDDYVAHMHDMMASSDAVASIKSHLSWLAQYLHEHVKIRKRSYVDASVMSGNEEREEFNYEADQDELQYPLRSYNLWTDWYYSNGDPLIITLWDICQRNHRYGPPVPESDLKRQCYDLGIGTWGMDQVLEDATKSIHLRRLKGEQKEQEIRNARNAFALLEWVAEKMGSDLLNVGRQYILDGNRAQQSCLYQWFDMDRLTGRVLFIHSHSVGVELHFRMLTFLLERIAQYLGRGEAAWQLLLLEPSEKSTDVLARPFRSDPRDKGRMKRAVSNLVANYLVPVSPQTTDGSLIDHSDENGNTQEAEAQEDEGPQQGTSRSCATFF